MPQVLDTPEILSLVFSYVDLSTCVSLLRVNKFYFHTAVSFVWNDLATPLDLLELIPGTVVEEVPDESLTSVPPLSLPSYSDADFTRFDIYAPHVRSLCIRSAFDKLTRWDTLVSKSRIGPLLPRLSSLKILQLPRYQNNPLTSELMWILVFLNSSVVSVHFRRETGVWAPAVSAPGLRSLLDTITRTCPNISSLSLPSINHNADEEHELLHILPTRPINQYISSLSGLCELEAGIRIFQADFITEIGFLPQLSHLILRPEREETPLPELSAVEENRFLALKKLTFSYVDWSDVKTLLEYPSLVRDITSFSICCPHDKATKSWDGARALILLNKMPKLCDLHIRFNDVTDCLYDLSMPEFLSTLSQLPLRTVHISGAGFSLSPPLRFNAVFPAVTELRIPQQRAGVRRLGHFAMMPQLKLLAVAFSNSDKKSTWLLDKSPCCQSLETLELTMTSGEEEELPDIYPTSFIHTAANHLLEMFPNIKRIIWPALDKRSYPYQQLCLLNTRIITIRHWNSARSRIVQKYGEDAADLLMPDESSLARALEPFV